MAAPRRRAARLGCVSAPACGPWMTAMAPGQDVPSVAPAGAAVSARSRLMKGEPLPRSAVWWAKAPRQETARAARRDRAAPRSPTVSVARPVLGAPAVLPGPPTMAQAVASRARAAPSKPEGVRAAAAVVMAVLSAEEPAAARVTQRALSEFVAAARRRGRASPVRPSGSLPQIRRARSAVAVARA